MFLTSLEKVFSILFIGLYDYATKPHEGFAMYRLSDRLDALNIKTFYPLKLNMPH